MSSNNLYEGTLYEYPSSLPITVQVLLYSDRIIVHYKKDGNACTRAWDFTELKKIGQPSIDTITLKNGENSTQTLVVQSEEFVRKFKPPLSKIAKLYHQFARNGGVVLGSISLFVIGSLFGINFLLFPWFVRMAAQHIPQEYEVKMGNQMYQSFIQNEQVDTNKTLLAQQFLKQIHFNTTYPLQVTVVKSSVKNAFAMPGGHIVVYSQLLQQIKSATELAALLGHEAGHVTHRHSTKHIFRNLSTFLVISTLFGDINGLSAVLIQQAGQLNQLSYSRDLEKEADEAGFETLLSNNINPQGMVDLFQTLQNGGEGGVKVPEFLSTHPISENRIAFIKEKIEKVKPGTWENPKLDALFQMLKQKN